MKVFTPRYFVCLLTNINSFNNSLYIINQNNMKNTSYFTSNGKYSPKQSEKIRQERKLAAVGYQQSLIKGKENNTVRDNKGNIKANSGTIMDRMATVNGVMMSFEDIWFAILDEYRKTAL